MTHSSTGAAAAVAGAGAETTDDRLVAPASDIIFVCSYFYPYEGYTEPAAAFRTRLEAEAWHGRQSWSSGERIISELVLGAETNEAKP